MINNRLYGEHPLNRLHIRTLQLLVLCFIMSVIPVLGQAPTNYVLTIWTFDKDQQYKADKDIVADVTHSTVTPTLKMDGGLIDNAGASGTSYTDICNTKYESTGAIEWEDVRGDDDNIVEDDAQLELTVDTTDWESLAFRFYYESDNTRSFDLSYHLGDGKWKLVADDVVIDASSKWSNIEVGLQDEPDIENRSLVVFLVHDFTRESGRGKLRMDNIAVVGKRISAPDDCPPVLEAQSTLEDIGILLNSDTIPSFTGDNGFQFTVTDDKTSFDQLTITALSSDPNIINLLGLSVIDAANGIFRFEIGEPHGFAGVADVTLRVTDTSGNITEQTFKYGVSDVPMSASTTYHRRTSQASAAVGLDDSMMVIANDATQEIHVYSRNQSGFPITTLDVSGNLQLEEILNDGTYVTVDIEAGTGIGNRQYWLGSHSNLDNGSRSSNRFRLFATETSGQGNNIQLAFIGSYDNLLDDLHRWGRDFDLNLRGAIRDDIRPSNIDGLNIEGLTIAPDGQTAYIGFRTPLIKKTDPRHALIAPLQNFTAWFNNGSPPNPATFDDPIQLNLGGLGIRGIECNANGCLIIAGSIDDEGLFALYSWSGNRADAPILRTANLTNLQPESLILPAGANFLSGETVQLISDSGNTDWYRLGKDFGALPANIQFFRSDYVVIE